MDISTPKLSLEQTKKLDAVSIPKYYEGATEPEFSNFIEEIITDDGMQYRKRRFLLFRVVMTLKDQGVSLNSICNEVSDNLQALNSLPAGVKAYKSGTIAKYITQDIGRELPIFTQNLITELIRKKVSDAFQVDARFITEDLFGPDDGKYSIIAQWHENYKKKE